MRFLADLWWFTHSKRSQPSIDYDNTYHGTSWHPRQPLVFYSTLFLLLLIILPYLLQSLGSLIVYLALINLGFLYVSYVTSNRVYPHLGRYGELQDLIITNILALPLYLTASLSTMFDEMALTSPSFLVFISVFFIGIHFTYFRWILPEFLLHSLTMDVFYKGDCFTKFSLILIASFPITLIGLHLYWIYDSGLALTYLGIYLPIIGMIFMITRACHPEYYVHVHHYQIALFGAPLAIFPSPFSVACAGLAISVFVEGAARWSYAPLWQRTSTKDDDDSSSSASSSH